MKHAPKTPTPALILASASPRRKEILEAHGHTPIVIPSDIDETLPEGVDFAPHEEAMYLAEQKAIAVFAAINSAGGSRDYPHGCTVLAVDTIVYKGRVIGKPKDEKDALDILRTLKGAAHEVISGVCAIKAAPYAQSLSITQKTVFYDLTTVSFGDYSDEEIISYVRENPPYDKSGSYAIQSAWSKHVKDVDGDIENVIGLPYKAIFPYL